MYYTVFQKYYISSIISFTFQYTTCDILYSIHNDICYIDKYLLYYVIFYSIYRSMYHILYIIFLFFLYFILYTWFVTWYRIYTYIYIFNLVYMCGRKTCEKGSGMKRSEKALNHCKMQVIWGCMEVCNILQSICWTLPQRTSCLNMSQNSMLWNDFE